MIPLKQFLFTIGYIELYVTQMLDIFVLYVISIYISANLLSLSLSLILSQTCVDLNRNAHGVAVVDVLLLPNKKKSERLCVLTFYRFRWLFNESTSEEIGKFLPFIFVFYFTRTNNRWQINV